MNRKIKKVFDRCVPASEKFLFFESEGDFCDNARALYEYMLENGYDEKYHFVWRVHNVEFFRKHFSQNNVTFVSRESLWETLRFYYYVSRCGYFFFTHPYWLKNWKKSQKVMALWHGTALKAGKGGCVGEKVYDYSCITSEHFRQSQAEFLGCNQEVLQPLGFPRNDLLLQTPDRKKICQFLNIMEGEKVLFWLPTFRNGKNIEESYFHSCTGLPLMETNEDLKWLEQQLKGIGLFVVVKLHHLQKEPTQQGEYEHIRFITDESLLEQNLGLYNILPFFDGLLTDYSSVSLDYLLCNRKMGFILDDLNEYESSRGFVVDNILDYLPGNHIYTKDQLVEYLKTINSSEDPYRSDREKLLKLAFDGQMEGASARILDFLGITV